jgi:hypothetical protein
MTKIIFHPSLLLLFLDPDPGWVKIRIRDKHPGSATLYARVDYNLTLCPLQSRLQHIYHGQPYARVDFITQSGTLDLASGTSSEY